MFKMKYLWHCEVIHVHSNYLITNNSNYEQTKLKRRFDKNPNCTLGINYQPSFFCVIIK